MAEALGRKGQRADGGNYEFDILAHNGAELVVVEVKTTLRPKDVKAFLRKLDQFKQWLPRYAKGDVRHALLLLVGMALLGEVGFECRG